MANLEEDLEDKIKQLTEILQLHAIAYCKTGEDKYKAQFDQVDYTLNVLHTLSRK